MKPKTHTIDASNKPMGRLATEIAVILRGKDKPEFMPNLDLGDFVVVKNVSEMKLSGKKEEKKIYYHHSGYPGGIKEVPLKKLGRAKVLRKAVWGMLPKNRLRAKMIKKLKIE